MGACEALGLLKMDFLGLRNLSVLDDCLENIMRNTGVEVVLETLGLDDGPGAGLVGGIEVGEPGALCVSLREAVLAPTDVGVNVTFT